MNNSIHHINFDIDKGMLIKESSYCQFVPINSVTLRHIQRGGKRFSDDLKKERGAAYQSYSRNRKNKKRTKTSDRLISIDN